MRDFDPTASEYITSGYIEHSRPGGRLYDPLTAGIVVGGTLLGSSMSADAASSAADTQAQASRDATQAQKDIFNTQVQLQEPWRQAGGIGLNALLYGLGLSPTGTFTPGAPAGSSSTPLLTQGADGVFAPATGSLADQIRQRLAPQFTNTTYQQVTNGSGENMSFDNVPVTTTDSAALEAAVQQELQRQQAAGGPQPIMHAGPGNQPDPGYGALMHDFSLADFQQDPGYAFRQSEQEKELQRARSASGSLGSGAYIKDALARSGDLASQEFTNAYNRYQTNRGTKLNALQSLSGVGQSSANTLTGAAGTLGANIGANIIGAGNAQAAGQVGVANALNGGISQGLSMYQQNQLLSRFPIGTMGFGGTPAFGPASFGGGGLMDQLSSYGVF